jgi:hypothetical protein
MGPARRARPDLTERRDFALTTRPSSGGGYGGRDRQVAVAPTLRRGRRRVQYTLDDLVARGLVDRITLVDGTVLYADRGKNSLDK